MNTIINETIEKLKQDLENFFAGEDTSVEYAEKYLGQKISETVLNLMTAFYEKADAEILKNKAVRKSEGLSVERRNEKRQILTQFGVLEYERTYYKAKDGTYSHPVDILAGIEANQKVSGGISLALIEAARTMSYGRSSHIVTGDQVSRQTVLHKIRGSTPKEEKIQEKKTVRFLHVDADEDHVHMQSGKNAMAPLISVYEGIERQGKRGACKNIFHCSEFEKRPDVLWEEALEEIEKRYDLENTKIYLHGDGAAWIKQGLEWLPNSVFVLDQYHKNKAIKEMVSGIDYAEKRWYESLIRGALEDGDLKRLQLITKELLQKFPQRKESILKASNYLKENFAAITIRNSDPEAYNGGATEPHVSHILSARLSSRPMGWSKETLKKFLPILAKGVENGETIESNVEVTPEKVKEKKHRKSVVPFTLGLPAPDKAVHLPCKDGKITQLYRALCHL